MAARKKTYWQRWKSRFPAEMRKILREEAKAKCMDRAWLESMCKRDGECLVWAGHVKARGSHVAPWAKRSEHAGMRADNAMYAAVHGKRLSVSRRLLRTCGNMLCIEPGHLTETNMVLEAAKRRIGWMP